MEPLPPPQESESQAQVELPQPQEFDPVDLPQESEPQAQVKQPQDFDPVDWPQESEQEFDPVDPSQESEPQASVELPQRQEFDQGPVDSPQESPPRPTIVCLDTAAKMAHKLLEKWYKEAGKQAEDDDNEPRPKEPVDEDRLCGFDYFDPMRFENLAKKMANFDPNDLSQYAGRYVAATRPTEHEPLNTYKSDDEEDNDAHDQRD